MGFLPGKSPDEPNVHIFKAMQNKLLQRLFVFLELLESCPDKKENKIFLIYKEIQKGAVAMSYYHIYD
jgi:hypothetical protein